MSYLIERVFEDKPLSEHTDNAYRENRLSNFPDSEADWLAPVKFILAVGFAGWALQFAYNRLFL